MADPTPPEARRLMGSPGGAVGDARKRRLDDQLNRACADGRLDPADADEVRRFAAFLDALAEAGIKPISVGGRRTGRAEAARKAGAIYLEHYPEHAPPVGGDRS